MKMRKLKITAKEGHFGRMLGYDDRETAKIPQPSTVLGILRLIYGEDVIEDSFRFGYRFRSGGTFTDGITIYKHSNKGAYKEKGKVATNIQHHVNHFDCELVIYTDLDREKIEMNRILSMGKSGNPARLELPVEEIELKEKRGTGYNQYTGKETGSGVVQRVSLFNRYNTKLNSYDHQKELVRFNEEFEYGKGYDEDADESIFLWEYRDGRVESYV